MPILNNAGVISNSIITSTGVLFDFANPQLNQIYLLDIARALSNTCRFGGQCEFYSVAEHSIHCAKVAQAMCYDDDIVLGVLMHDATEAYIGDMPRPLKLMFPEYKELERKIEKLIWEKFSLNPALLRNEKVIKDIDNKLLKAEINYFFPDNGYEWPFFDNIPNVEVDFKGWSPSIAEVEFLTFKNKLRTRIY